MKRVQADRRRARLVYWGDITRSLSCELLVIGPVFVVLTLCQLFLLTVRACVGVIASADARCGVAVLDGWREGAVVLR